MKFSRFNIEVPNYPEEGQSLLYNTMTQALVKINSEVKDLVGNYSEASEDKKQKHSDTVNKMKDMGLVVEDDGSEKDKLDKFFQQLKYSILEKYLPVTIMVTGACNFKCRYCYQQGIQNKEKMSLSTADSVIEWIKNKMEQGKYEKLCIVFHGGEPLLGKTIIEYIAVKMKIYCEQRDKGFSFMIQTNGYLMNKGLMSYYKKIGLSEVRVSLDGIKEDHDKNRPYCDGSGTFNRIADNIIKCVDDIKIGISVSYEKGKVDHIERLLNWFSAQGILSMLGDFIFAPIHPAIGNRGCPESLKNKQCLNNFSDKELIAANKRIYELMKEKNLPIKDGLAISACPLIRENGAVSIDANGRIFKCNSMLGHEEFSVGDVCCGQYNAKHKEFLAIDAWKKCVADCPYIPMCSGGCRLFAFFKNKNFNEPTCYRDYLNTMVPEFIKRQYALFLEKRS